MPEITRPEEHKLYALWTGPAPHCCSLSTSLSVGVSGPRLGENCEQVLVAKEKHEVQMRGLWEGFIVSWWHETNFQRKARGSFLLSSIKLLES